MSDQRTEQSRARRGLVGRTLGGRYRVERMVSAGAATLIVDAEDTELNRPVTVKLIRPEWAEDPEFRRTFRGTMRAMSGLSHPNVAAIYDWGEEQVGQRTTVYAVSEYLVGGSLRDLFDRGRYLDPSQALLVGLEACRGLDFAHRKGLVHTELTPSKLVFGDDRRLRIVDFGLAHILGSGAWSESATMATHVARYASPEQAQGEPVEGRSDVYSLALILVEAVTRTVPFSARSTVATLSARVGKLMPVSADLGPLAAVLERAGRPIAADRSTAAEFGRGLVRVAEKLPRPEPIPILVTARYDDRQSMRRPNDPTGGLARPKAQPGTPIVPPPGPSDPAPAGEAPTEPPDARPEAPRPPVEPLGPSGLQPLVAPAIPAVEGEAPPAPPSAVETHAVDASEPGAPSPADDDPPTELAEAGPPTGPAEDVDAPAPTAPDTGSQALPPPAAPGEPRLYDGDDDITKDELAALARREAAATQPPSAPSTPPTSVSEPPSSTPPSVPAASEPSAWSRRLESLDDGTDGRSRWFTALAAFVVLALLAGLGFVAYLLFRVPTHEVPDLVGMTQQQAEAAVLEFDWEIDVQRERSDDEPDPGDVVRTTPDAGEDLAVGEPFLLVVSEGPELRTLPELDGLTRGEAETTLAELRLQATTAGEEFSEDVPPGHIVSWSVPADPALTAGGEVLPETEVSFVVSKGPEPRTVPDLRGLTVEDASAQLDDLRLEVEVAEAVFDNDIVSGAVVTFDPPAGTSVERDSTVTLTPSKGPDLVVVPDVAGQTLDQARATLGAAGLQVGAIVGNSAGTVAQMAVSGSIVSPGDQFLRNSAVDLALL